MYGFAELENLKNNFNKKCILVSMPTTLSNSEGSMWKHDIAFDCVNPENFEFYKSSILPSIFRKYNIYSIEVQSYEIVITTKRELDLDTIDMIFGSMDYNYHDTIVIGLEIENITVLSKKRSRNKKYPTIESLRRDDKKHRREELYKEIENKKYEIKRLEKQILISKNELEKLISKLTDEEKLLYEIGELK